MADPTDKAQRQLIRDYLQGDRAAIQVLDEWIDVVLRDRFRSLRADWDDLRQETRIRVYRNLARDAFDGRSALRTYVHRIANNTCIDYTRRAYRYREEVTPPADRPSLPDAAERGLQSRVSRDLLVRVLDDSSEGDRQLIHLVFVEHRAYREIADLLGIPEGTVKSRMARCKERMLRKRRELVRRGEWPL